MSEAYIMVREFTYYPIISIYDCWFRVPTKPGARTYHQCPHHGTENVEGIPFCKRHAKRVNEAIKLEAGV